MKNYILLMRPKHYLKNILIFFPIVFSGQMYNRTIGAKALWGALSFCLITSVVYICNDIADCEQDKLHSTKKNRPIASGRVTVMRAVVFAFVLFAASCFINFFVLRNILSGLLILVYFAINIGYSIFGLKHIAIVDVVILMCGFLLRVAYGAAVTDIPVSNWLYLTIVSVSFYMGLGKRRNEKVLENGETRMVLKYYTKEFLDKNMYMCLTLAIVFYSLWCVSPDTISRHAHANVIVTVPLVIIGAMKYSLDIEQNESDGDPIEVILKDNILIVLGVVYSIIMFCIIYGV